jgi:hypothetical protein
LNAVFMLVWLLAILSLYSLITGSVLALFLRLGCSLLGERGPSFPRALKIGALSFWLQCVPLLLVGVHRGMVVLWPVLAVLIAAWLYSVMLPIRFARAVSLALIQILVVGGGVFALGLVFHTWWARFQI